MKLKNYRKLYEEACKVLDAALMDAACKTVEIDRLHKKIEELETVNRSQEAELKAVYGKIEAAKQILLRAKR